MFLDLAEVGMKEINRHGTKICFASIIEVFSNQRTLVETYCPQCFQASTGLVM